MIEEGYCQCGCGKKTSIVKDDIKRLGYKKGDHYRYCHGHGGGSCGFRNNHPKWKGGKSRISKVYPTTLTPGHERAGTLNREKNQGYVRDHILLAEKALGRPISIEIPVHHYPQVENCEALIICQNAAYHKFLHTRQRALFACGNVHWKKCVICKKYDDSKNLVQHMEHGKAKAPYHRECRIQYRHGIINLSQ